MIFAACPSAIFSKQRRWSIRNIQSIGGGGGGGQALFVNNRLPPQCFVFCARRRLCLKGVQLTLSHICISVLVLYQHDDLFGDFLYYNALLFPTHLMCTRHSISERLTTYMWFQPGSVKFILFCKYSCIPLMRILCSLHIAFIPFRTKTPNIYSQKEINLYCIIKLAT